MHSLQGAFSESLYLYLETLKACLQFNSPPAILSLGLGLAYNEIISIAYFQQYQQDNFHITSFEKDPRLQDALWQWLELGPNTKVYPWLCAYETICELTAQHFNLQPQALKLSLKKTIQSEHWTFKGALTPETSFSTQANCIYYDAFSEKTDPQLWNCSNLHKWLESACQPHCALGSYAAKGVLNRTLAKLGFSLAKRAGFSGKKQCTLATR